MTTFPLNVRALVSVGSLNNLEWQKNELEQMSMFGFYLFSSDPGEVLKSRSFCVSRSWCVVQRPASAHENRDFEVYLLQEEVSERITAFAPSMARAAFPEPMEVCFLACGCQCKEFFISRSDAQANARLIVVARHEPMDGGVRSQPRYHERSDVDEDRVGNFLVLHLARSAARGVLRADLVLEQIRNSCL